MLFNFFLCVCIIPISLQWVCVACKTRKCILKDKGVSIGGRRANLTQLYLAILKKQGLETISLFFGEYPSLTFVPFDKHSWWWSGNGLFHFCSKPYLLSTPETFHCKLTEGSIFIRRLLCAFKEEYGKRCSSSSPSPMQFQSAFSFPLNSQGIYFYTVQFRWIAGHFTLFSNDVWVLSSSLIKLSDPGSIFWQIFRLLFSYYHDHNCYGWGRISQRWSLSFDKIWLWWYVGQTIFHKPKGKWKILLNIYNSKIVILCLWTVYKYCILPNHVHLYSSILRILKGSR